MILDCAKYSSLENNDEVRFEQKGSNGFFVVTSSENEVKGRGSVASKVAKVLMETYFKRPSLKTMAFETIAEIANDAVMVLQSPTIKTTCDFVTLALIKNRIRWSRAGKSSLFHFVDGELYSRTDLAEAESLGSGFNFYPEIYGEEVLEKGDHYFVMCSKNLSEKVSDVFVEKCVRASDSANEVVNHIVSRCASSGDSDLSLCVLHLPPRKKKSVIGIILAAILAAAVLFFIVGAMGKMKQEGMMR